jgi:hypothetical protein
MVEEGRERSRMNTPTNQDSFGRRERGLGRELEGGGGPREQSAAATTFQPGHGPRPAAPLTATLPRPKVAPMNLMNDNPVAQS